MWYYKLRLVFGFIFQAVPQNEGDLALRFDYGAENISWEIVTEGPSTKHKIEIDWSNIIGIQASTEDHRQGTLQLEVNFQLLLIKIQLEYV